MSNYTPSLDQVRGRYCDGTTVQTGHVTDGHEFDRAIAKVRAEAKAEALLEAVSALNEVVEEAAAHGITNGLAWQTGALAMRDQLKIRADKLVTE